MTPAGTGSSTVVEFVGMPAVGKTSVADAVSRSASVRRLGMSRRALDIGGARRSRRVVRKLALIVWLVRVEPAAAREVGAFVARSIRPWRPGFLRVLVNWLYVLGVIRREAARHPLVILDQGIAQGLWSTLYRAQATPERSAAVDFIGRIVARAGIGRLIVVHLRAKDELVRRRVETRSEGHSPLDSALDEDAFRDALEVTRVVGGVLSRTAETLPEVTLIECEATDVEAAASWIIGMLSSAGHSSEGAPDGDEPAEEAGSLQIPPESR